MQLLPAGPFQLWGWKSGRHLGDQNYSLDKWHAHSVSDPVPGQGRGLAQAHEGSKVKKNGWINHEYMAGGRNQFGLN